MTCCKGAGAVVEIGADHRDSEGQSAWTCSSGRRAHRPRKLPLVSCGPGMGLGSVAQLSALGPGFARVSRSCDRGGG